MSFMHHVCFIVLLIFSQVGWIVAFVGFCISNVSVHPISWWIAVYELALVIFVCTVLGTGRMTMYRLVVSEYEQSEDPSFSFTYA